TLVHEDRVGAAAGEAANARDAGEDLLAAHRGDLDRLVAGRAADVVDDERLVWIVHAHAANACAAADVQPELARRRPGRDSVVLRVGGRAPVTGEEDRLGQLESADLEPRRLRDRHEQQIDLHLDGDDDVDGAAAERLEGRTQAESRERDAEELGLDAGREAEPEVEDGRPEGRAARIWIRILAEEDTERELSDEAEVFGAEDEPAGDLEVEVTVGAHPPLRGESREAEEIGIGREVEDPLA